MFVMNFGTISVLGFPFSQISHLFLDYLLFSNFPKPLFLKRPSLIEKCKKRVSKNTITKVFKGDVHRTGIARYGGIAERVLR